jgi:subtilisin family serine protease
MAPDGTLAPGPTGRGVRIAIVDSGVHVAHPHVGSVAGGVAIDDDGREHGDYVDRLGHGTAVTAAIKEKAPDAELYAVKVFDRALSTRTSTLVGAIDWAARNRMHVVNLSLGTANAEHERALAEAVQRAAAAGVVIVAAAHDDGVRWLPGSLAGVVGVQLDATCPRDDYRAIAVNGTTVFRASGYPREIPGVPPERNLNGISFAVANMTGFVARARETSADGSVDTIIRALLVFQPPATSHQPPK